MGRAKRIVVPGYPHHITQRGNNKQEVFNDHNDCRKYLSLLAKYSIKYKLKIISYCLMPNHVHLIEIPAERDSLWKTIHGAHTGYSKSFSRKSGAVGHLWQQRFFSCVLDGRHLVAAARYIERNPIRAGMVDEPWEWEWSSARYHLGLEKEEGVIQGNLFDYISIRQEDWSEFIRNDDDPGVVDKLKRYTKIGVPLGEGRFFDKLKLGKKTAKMVKFFPIWCQKDFVSDTI